MIAMEDGKRTTRLVLIVLLVIMLAGQVFMLPFPMLANFRDGFFQGVVIAGLVFGIVVDSIGLFGLVYRHPLFLKIFGITSGLHTVSVIIIAVATQKVVWISVVLTSALVVVNALIIYYSFLLAAHYESLDAATDQARTPPLPPPVQPPAQPNSLAPSPPLGREPPH